MFPFRFSSKKKRIIAGALVFALLLSTVSLIYTSRIPIKSEQNESPGIDSAASSVLANNNDYIEKNTIGRLGGLMDTVGPQTSLSGLYNRADIQIAREEFAEALETIRRCIDIYINTGEENEELLADLWLKKGCLHVILGAYDEALVALDSALGINYEIADAFLVKAQVYQELGMYRELSANLGSYIELMQNQTEDKTYLAELWLTQGSLHLHHGSYEEALGAINNAIRHNSEMERAYLMQAQVFAELERYEEMHGSIEQYLRLAPDDTDMIELLAQTREDLSRLRAGEAMGTHETTGNMSKSPSEHELIMDMYAMLEEGLRSAEGSFIGGTQTSGSEAAILNYLIQAQINAESGDFGTMCLHLESYLAEVPDDIAIRTILANARFSIGEHEKAMEQYSILLNYEEDAELEYYLGLAALQLSSFQAAEGAFTRSIAISDTQPAVYYYRGVSRLAQDKYAEATSDFTSSIQRGEVVHSSFFSRGTCLLMLEEYDRGITDIRIAADMDEDQTIKEQAIELLAEIEQ